jgi:hypothetical protein
VFSSSPKSTGVFYSFHLDDGRPAIGVCATPRDQSSGKGNQIQAEIASSSEMLFFAVANLVSLDMWA